MTKPKSHPKPKGEPQFFRFPLQDKAGNPLGYAYSWGPDILNLVVTDVQETATQAHKGAPWHTHFARGDAPFATLQEALDSWLEDRNHGSTTQVS